MRRNRRFLDDEMNMKIIKYASIGVGILAIIVLGLLIYSKSLNDEVKEESLSSEQFADLMQNSNNNSNNTTSVSTEMGKTVNEASNELNTTSNTNFTNMTENMTSNATNNTAISTNTNTSSNSTSTSNASNTNSSTQNSNNSSNSNNNTSSNSNADKAETKQAEISFSKPVEGEIVKEFAQDNLIYSNTLEEWTTHTGIDIKAEKTTVVKSAEAGMVKSIKNDPRYGLTIVIEHQNGFQTVYSNLLTSEFVVEGENVEKGQSLGTVGNTAAFEIADEPHLHFEILKDSVAVDPSIYLK